MIPTPINIMTKIKNPTLLFRKRSERVWDVKKVYKVLRLPKTLIILGNIFVLNHHSKEVINSYVGMFM